MAENRFKHKLFRMFRGSFGSCRSRHLSDVIEKSTLSPETMDENINLHSFHMVEEPPKLLPRPGFPSICRPKYSEPVEHTDIVNKCLKSTAMDVMLPIRPKLSDRLSPFSMADPSSYRISIVHSVFPLNPFYEQRKNKKNNNNHHNTKKKKNRSQYKKSTNNKKTKSSSNNDQLFVTSSSRDSNLGGGEGWWWYSSDDEKEVEEEDETETLFSSKSLTSDSSESRRRRRYSRRRRRAVSEVGLVPLEAGRSGVKDSFAVVKKSSDPHNDFRTSMVEMIVEKQIFSAKDLEKLLQCFLSLNSEHHHRVIVEVFTEILEALFSNWGS